MLGRLLVLSVMLSSIIEARPQQLIAPDYYQQDLVNYLMINYKTSDNLDYDDARDIMYSLIDMHDDSLLSCVYTGFTIALDPSKDPSTEAFYKGVNCEHSWPQSMGADQEPQKSDMHHLFPCKSNVNSSRGNDPYAQIPDANTDKWYNLASYQSTVPTNNIDDYAEKENDGQQTFEPREAHKGDAARAMFYFYSIYNDVADTNFWNLQKDVLLQWHYADPVDQREYDRTMKIASYQDNIPNPFILDSTLARRILHRVTKPVSTTKNSKPNAFQLVQNYPNPFNPSTWISYELPERSSVRLVVFDLSGHEVLNLQHAEKPPGHYEFQWNGLDNSGNPVGTGVYFCRLESGGLSQTIKMVYLR